MKKVMKYAAFAVLALAFGFTSCESEESLEPQTSGVSFLDNVINLNKMGNRTPVTDQGLLDGIRTLDLDVGVVSIGDFHLPDGTIEERIYIGNDITFTREELDFL